MACDVLIDSQIQTGGASYLNANEGDEAVNSQSAVGTSFFNPTNRYAICTVKFYLRMGNVGSDGNLEARLYEAINDGSGLVPTGNPLAISNTVLVENLPSPWASYQWIDFEFPCGSQYCMEASHNYVVVIVLSGSTTVTPTNAAVSIGFKLMGIFTGAYVDNIGGVWRVQSTYKTCIYIYGNLNICNKVTCGDGLSIVDSESEDACYGT